MRPLCNSHRSDSLQHRVLDKEKVMQCTKEEIAKRLGTLEDFHTFLVERDKAFHAGEVDLNASFVLLGRFWLIGRSNGIYRLQGYDEKPLLPDDVTATLDPVLTEQEFRDVLKKHGREQGWSGGGGGGGTCIPPLHARCPRCGQGWTIATCHDAHHEEGVDHPSFDEFVGKNFREARAVLEKRAQHGGVLYHLSPDVYGDQEDEYGHKEERQCSVLCPLDESDEESKKAHDALWDYIIQPGDSGVAWVTTIYHSGCLADLTKDREDGQFADMLRELPEMFEREGGFTSVTLEEFVPDEVCMQRLRDWMQGCEDGDRDEEDNEEFLRAYRWVTVRTGEGTFRIGYLSRQRDSGGDCPQLLDLGETGLTYADLLNAPGASGDMSANDFRAMTAQMPAAMLESSICAFMIEPQFLRNLRYLLQRKA